MNLNRSIINTLHIFVCFCAIVKSNKNTLLVISLMSCAILISPLKVNAAAPSYQPNSQPNSQPVNEQQRLARHVVSLNELTERRRTNRLFHNEQSPLYGERIEYTNIGKGNSSFVMRDMVLINRLPLIFARVYDSNSGISDFGIGWRLNYNESITIKKNGDLVYLDESGSEHLIIQVGNNRFYPQYHFAQIQSVKRFGKQIQLTFNSGVIKSFDLIGKSYKLSQIKDVYANQVDIDYHQGKIVQISNNQGQLITINRNPQGLIANIIDHHQRKIVFNYEKGLLKSSQDLAGNLWQYQYTNGLLHTITDPEQNQVIKFDYYHTGINQNKTAKLTLGNQTFAFDYQGNITTVTNQLQQQTQFEQNRQGVTVAVSNHQGLVTRLGLNNKLQLIKLLENDLTIAELIYDDNHQPQTLIKTGKAYSLAYQHQQLHTIGKTHAEVNTKGKPTAFSANGMTRHYKYNHLGEVTEQREHTPQDKEILSSYLYDKRGLLEYLTVKGQTAHFKYNQFGQLERINFPNGAYHYYQYNDLGLRNKTIRSDGSTIDYSYDAAGVLLNLMQNDNKGNHQLKEMHYNHNNLATEYIVDGHMMLDIKYDEANNPTSISYNGNPVEYRYDQHNRLTTIIDGDNHLHYHYKHGESDIRIQQDQRSFISRLSKGRSSHNSVNINHAYTRTVGTPHQFVYFDPYLHQFKMPSFEQMVATDINHDASQRRRLYNAVSKQKNKQRDFDKPSNSLFFPPTYRGVHCDLDYCWEVVQVDLSGPVTATIGQAVTFTATPIIANMYDDNDNLCDVRHRFSVDGQIITYNSSGIFNYTFGSTGNREVQVRSNCQNCATWNFQYDSLTVQSQAQCYSDDCFTVATTTIASMPVNKKRRIIGVGEEVILECSITPCNWRIVSGNGSLGGIRNRNGEIVFGYIAGEQAASTTLEASAGQFKKTVEFTIIAPNSITMERAPFTNVNHIYGVPGVGWRAQPYIGPDTVSFYKLKIYEPYIHTVRYITTGYFNYQAGYIHYPANYCCSDGAQLSANTLVYNGKGTIVNGEDWIQGGGGSYPYSAGSATWNIPWSYKVGSSTTSYIFTTLPQMKTIDQFGGMSLSKGGHSEFRALYAPTTSWTD